MLDLTCLGHATLLVQTKSVSVLCDPIVGRSVSGGGNLIYPEREVHLDHLPSLAAILISHHHSDHFSIADLEQVPGCRAVPILAPEGSPVLSELRRHGFPQVDAIRVGVPVTVGDLTVTPTPSAVAFPEVGFLFRAVGATALNLVDSSIHGVMDSLLAFLPERIDLVLAPFQSGGYMFFHPLRIGGPPEALGVTIQSWAEAFTEQLVEDVMRLRPGHVVPFADGLSYVDTAMNAWHFPLADEVFLQQMAGRGVPGTRCRPGLRLRVEASKVETAEDSSLVTLFPSLPSARNFNAAVRLNDRPMACREWNRDLRGREVDATTHSAVQRFQDRIGTNIDRFLQAFPDPAERQEEVDLLHHWFLELCDQSEASVYLVPTVSSESGATVQRRHSLPLDREYGVRLHGSDLWHLSEGRILLEDIVFGGAFRYHSPPRVDDLKRLRRRVFGPLDAVVGNLP
jgi:L-ascorbate metabolism protein UlaG (beta-lactamase superfamily)